MTARTPLALTLLGLLAAPRPAAAAEDFMWPLTSYISQPYFGNISGSCPGTYYDQYNNALYTSGSPKVHRAVDLPGNYGTPIRAARGGRARSGFDGSFGNYVIMDHGGAFSFYAHLKTAYVGSSWTTKITGDTIGEVGATGSGTNPYAYHLHFEIRSAGSTNCPDQARYIPGGNNAQTNTGWAIPFDYPGIGAPANVGGMSAWAFSSTAAHFQFNASATPGSTYWVDISTSPSFSSFSNRYLGTGTSTDWYGLISGQKYYWRVYATNGPHWNGSHSYGPAVSTGALIINANAGKCLEVDNYATWAGAQIQQWGCYNGNNQRWRMDPLGGGYWQIKNTNSGLCMDVAGASGGDGASVLQWYCHGGANQRFLLNWTGWYYEIRPAHVGGKCVEIYGISTADGADAVQWGCWGGWNQLWTVQW